MLQVCFGNARGTALNFQEAMEAAFRVAKNGKPGRVERDGVLLATVHVDGGIDFTPEGAAENRS